MAYYRTMINKIATTCCDLGESHRHNTEEKSQTQKCAYYVIPFL